MLMPTARIIPTLLWLLLLPVVVLCDDAVRVMPRVDTSHVVVRRVVQAWVDSIGRWRTPSSPDADRTMVPGSAASVMRSWFSQSTDLIATFSPTILSVEPDSKGRYIVRTLFSAIEPESRNVIPLGQMKTVVSVSDDGISAVNMLDEATEGWERTTVDMITYLMPPDSEMNRQRMRNAARFVRSIADSFHVEAPESITYVVARTRDELCSVLGLEYFAMPPQGLAWPLANMIVVGNGDVGYAHELVHLVLHKYDDAHPVVREGIATLFGGSLGTPYSVLVKDYREKRRGTVPSFTSLFTEDNVQQDDVYVLGAALCDIVRKNYGTDGLKALLEARTTSETMHKLSYMLGIEPNDAMGGLDSILDQACAAVTEGVVSGR